MNTLYRHFFAYQLHLDRVADSLDKQSKDGSGFRNHFQHELGFTDAEYALVRASAQRLEAALADQDTKAKAVIDATRARFPRQLASPSGLPPVPPELVQLQKGRDAMIEQEVTNLKAALGSKNADKLDTLLRNQFAPNVKVKNVPVPMPHDPGKNPPPPFRPEAQP